jgi:hypothetical protein
MLAGVPADLKKAGEAKENPITHNTHITHTPIQAHIQQRKQFRPHITNNIKMS